MTFATTASSAAVCCLALATGLGACSKEPTVPHHQTTSRGALVRLALAGDAAALDEALASASPETVVEAAAELLVEHDGYSAPEELLRRAVATLGSDHGVIQLHLGGLALLQGERDRALKHYRAATEGSRPDARAHTSVSALLAAAGDDAGAVAAARRAHEAMPADILTINNLITVLAHDKAHLAEAKALFDKHAPRLSDTQRYTLQRAMAQDPDLPDHYVHSFPAIAAIAFDRGQRSYRQGRKREAIAYWVRATNLDPLNEAYAAELGATYGELGMNDEALALYGRILGLQPYSPLCFNQGNALLRLQRVNEAVAAYRTCLKVLPSWADPRANLASALMALGRFDDAEAELGALAKHHPTHRVLAPLRAQLVKMRAAGGP